MRPMRCSPRSGRRGARQGSEPGARSVAICRSTIDQYRVIFRLWCAALGDVRSPFRDSFRTADRRPIRPTVTDVARQSTHTPSTSVSDAAISSSFTAATPRVAAAYSPPDGATAVDPSAAHTPSTFDTGDPRDRPATIPVVSGPWDLRADAAELAERYRNLGLAW